MSKSTHKAGREDAEAGFMLLACVVMIFLIFLALSVAAPRIAKELKHDREVETEHRAAQYVRAIQLYYRKNNNQYPASVEALKKTNNIRFLRQEYKDPMTGQADWRLIHVGQNKSTVKDFFGKEFAAPAAGGLGTLAGSASSGVGSAGAVNSSSGSAFGAGSGSGSAFGGSGGSGSGSSFGATGNPPGSVGSAGAGAGAGAGSGAGTAPSGSLDSLGKAGGGPIMGIGSAKSGDAMLTVNEQTTYQDWEFLYDPRLDARKAKVNILGGGLSSTGSSSLGSLGGSGSIGSGSSGGTGTGTGAGGSTGYNPNAPANPSTPKQ